MKKGKMIGVAVMAAGLLTGCMDHMPDMTEEQSALVAEYAADMLLKYSPNYDYKIADEEVLVDEEPTEAVTEEMTEEAAQEQTTVEVEMQVEQETAPEEDSALRIVDAKDVDFAETFGIEDISIRYDSMELCTAYPSGEIGTGFSVNAADGNTLLVMHLTVENTSEAVITCDLFEKDFDVSMNLNGGNYKKLSSTLLVNDFTTYMEEIPVGESTDVVIVAEVEKISEEEISSCILRMTSGDASITTKLK